MEIRDRIKELRRVRASELIPNPKNWRTHPVSQQEAVTGILSEIGYADALIARETPDGLMLIDGHLRAELTPASEVPVLVLDINEAEADLLLMTLDPLAAMAGRNEERLAALLESVASADDAVNALLESIPTEYEPLTFVEPEPENPYVQVVDTPIYEPTGDQPDVDKLADRSTADGLIGEIRKAGLPVEIEKFLLDAAERHVAFNYQRIANYYAHAPTDVQELMEQSALVIIDYDQAIENGFIHLKEDLDASFKDEYPHA
jgi:hypothetical protein